MAKREHKVILPKFGKYLAYLRKSRNLKQSQVIYKSRRIKDGCMISSSNLSRYEAGKTGDPSLSLLKTFSLIYNEPLENIVKILMEEKFEIDFDHKKPDHSFIKESDASYDIRLEDITEMIKKLNNNGMFILKAVLKGLINQKAFLNNKANPDA